MQFDTKRSEVGELLYKLKFNRDETAVPEITEALETFVKSWNPNVDLIVPVPPTSERALQPVIVLAKALSQRLGIAVVDCIKRIRETPQLKNVYRS